MQPRRYSTFERALWKGYLLTATPLVLTFVFVIVLAVRHFLSPNPTSPPFPELSAQAWRENWGDVAAPFVFLAGWGIGMANFTRGLPKSWKEFCYLLLSLANFAYMGIGILTNSGDDNALIQLITQLIMMVVWTIHLLPAAFLLALVAARSY